MLMFMCVVQPCPDSVYYELTRNLVIIAGVAIGIAIVIVSICPSLLYYRCRHSLSRYSHVWTNLFLLFCFTYKTLEKARNSS